MPKIIAAGVGLPLIGTGATVTTSQPLLNLTQTWNNVATSFTGLKFNVTDTASASGSLLMDLQVGGVSQLKATKTGEVTAVSRFIAPFYYVNNDTGAIFFGASLDTVIRRDGAANILALRNGTAAQAFNVYNTYTDASNYERGIFDWTTNPGNLTIGTARAGTGTAKTLLVAPSGNLRLRGGAGETLSLGISGAADFWQLTNTGHFLADTDNAYDIGASGANRPRTGYFGTSVSVGAGYGWLNSKGAITQAVDGQYTFSNFAGTQSVTATIGASNLLTLNGGLTTTNDLIVPAGKVVYVGDTGMSRLAFNSLTLGSSNGSSSASLTLTNLNAGGYVKTQSTTVAGLTAAATAGAGARSFVTDATATTFLSTVAGGGANKVPVVSDGTNWLIG